MTGAARPPGRDRMIASAAGLIGRRGVEGASFAEILSASGAPRGSIYYYFPAGKTELVDGAVRWTVEAVLAHQRACRARTPGGVVRHFVSFFRRSLSSSGCELGCPLAAVAVGSYARSADMRGPIRQGFRAWTALLAAQLRAAGLPGALAGSLATATVASVEGALILARAEGSLGPLDRVEAQLRRLATTAGPPGRDPERRRRRSIVPG